MPTPVKALVGVAGTLLLAAAGFHWEDVGGLGGAARLCLKAAIDTVVVALILWLFLILRERRSGTVNKEWAAWVKRLDERRFRVVLAVIGAVVVVVTYLLWPNGQATDTQPTERIAAESQPSQSEDRQRESQDQIKGVVSAAKIDVVFRDGSERTFTTIGYVQGRNQPPRRELVIFTELLGNGDLSSASYQPYDLRFQGVP